MDFFNHKLKDQSIQRIEIFVDRMIEQRNPNGSWKGGEIPFSFHESDKLEQSLFCKCPLRDHKSFTRQLYKLLQYYGMFSQYMTIMCNENYEDIEILIEQWLSKTDENIMEKNNKNDKIDIYNDILLNIKRIGFLMSFNFICCKDKKKKNDLFYRYLKIASKSISQRIYRLQKYSEYGFIH